MRAPAFSPGGFLARAALAAIALAALHLLGLREHASILSGTLPGSALETGAGVAYVCAWFAAVVGAPRRRDQCLQRRAQRELGSRPVGSRAAGCRGEHGHRADERSPQ